MDTKYELYEEWKLLELMHDEIKSLKDQILTILLKKHQILIIMKIIIMD